ncbi:gamma-glutamyltransferase [Nocardioides solisilvae]|uniref:gamma-glutamyltransferase n=1 Tax=Nocardioides solisilvae TaxID=1542435 RepID=UPI0023B7CC92|nr:gamma-glutamyltransferase [Nocardioides solisilvae]
MSTRSVSRPWRAAQAAAAEPAGPAPTTSTSVWAGSGADTSAILSGSRAPPKPARVAATRASRRLWLPGGHAPRVGQRFRNPDLARTYRLLARDGVAALHEGPLAPTR